MIGCGGGSPCEQVLNSRWSTIAGILPVSGLAAGVYLALLIASFFIGPAIEAPVRRLAWSAMLILAGSVAGSAIWFTIIQKWVIGYFCPYCMTTHITGLLLATLVIWRALAEYHNQSNNTQLADPVKANNKSQPAPRHSVRYIPAIGPALIGFGMAAILAAFQVGLTPSAVYRDGESKVNLPAIDYHTIPMVGSPDAPYIVTLLFDYQCPHCQKIHFMLNEAIQRYNGKLAFALCPAPLNNECNPYIPVEADAYKNSCELARISLVVWVARREAFSAFENWMFTFESGDSWHPRSLETARAKAVELIGQEKFDAAWSEPWIGQYIQACVQIYGQTILNGKGGVPKFIYGSHWVVPELYSTDNLVMILHERLAVPKP